ncbi:MAG: glutamate--tRNA ligase [Patescibacteria group bacterium]
MEVRTRIAPSPTGPLHLGTARTALFNWLFARQHQGKFILRIEDTDKVRSRPEFEEDIVEGLKWLGTEWDEFYRQSERIEVYKKYLKKLLDSGQAYFSDVIHFKNPGPRVRFGDLIRGELEIDTRELGDFIIAKSEEEVLYHFAVVIDDFEMKISHVIRGEDHISNTPRQILIQEALGFPRPQYAHLPLILGPDRTKLSKRHGAESIREYKEMGYLPEALVNFLSLLGWHPKDEKEMFSKEELIKEFSLERVQKGGAVFDIKKLDWMNSEYIRRKSPSELLELSRLYLGRADDEKLEKITALEQLRLIKLSELREKTAYFFTAPEYPKELLRWKGTESYEVIKKHLEKICELLMDWEKIMAYAEKEGKGEVLWPLRAALSGRRASPGPFEIMEVLGKEESEKRIQYALRLLD